MKRSLAMLPALFLALIVVVSFIRSRAAPVGIGTEPEIVSFTANPTAAESGQPVTLAWNARGADSLTLDWSTRNHPDAAEPARTRLPDSGTMVVHPKRDTVYTLTCETADGPMCSTSVTVRAK